MSLHSDSEDQSSVIEAALNAAFPLINQEDANQTNLYNKIRANPNLKNSQKKTIELLLQIIQKMTTTQISKTNSSTSDTTINRLLSHLESHVVLLEALSHNPELASLFLVGSSGSQSFSSLQKSVLLEQASRLRFFLGQFKNSNIPIRDSISDFEKNLTPTALKTLSEKLEELDSIKTAIENEEYDLVKVKNAFKEVCSLLETSILFNDFLIQKGNDHRYHEGNRNLQNELIEIKEQKEQIESQLYKVKSQLCSQQNMIRNHHDYDKSKSKYRKKIAQLETDKIELVRQISELKESTMSCKRCNERETNSMKTENRQLSSQIDLLNQQICNYQSMNEQKDEKIDRLKTSISEYSQKLESMHQLNSKQRNEVDNLKKIYQNVSIQLQTATDQLNQYRIQYEKLNKVNKKAAKENSELKSLLERANESNQKHLKDNAALIKQIRINDENNNPDEVEQLKAKNRKLKTELHEARKFINQLQEEIEAYKQQNSNLHSNQNKYDNSSLSSYNEKQIKRKRAVHKTIKTELFNNHYEEDINEFRVKETILSKPNKNTEEESFLSKSNKNPEEESFLSRNKNAEDESFLSKSNKHNEEESFLSKSNKNAEEESFLSKLNKHNEEGSFLSKSNKDESFHDSAIEIEEEEEAEEESINAFLKHLSNEDKINGLNEEEDIGSILSSLSQKNSKKQIIFDEEEDKSSSNMQIGSSIMPSFDELEHDIQILEKKVKKTRILVAENLK